MKIGIIIIILIITAITIRIVWRRTVGKAFYKVLLRRKTKKKTLEMMEGYGFDIEKLINVPCEELTVESYDGLKLKGYLYKNKDNTNKVIVISHGYTQNHYFSLMYLEFFLKIGYNVLAIDARAHGQSEGEYPTYGVKESEDLHSWIIKMKEVFNYNCKIGVLGQSLAGASVLMYAGKYNEVDFVIADSPFSSGKEELRWEFKRKYGISLQPLYFFLNNRFKRKAGFDMNESKPMEYILKTDIPVMFVHGITDELIPYSMSVDMYERRKNPNDRLLLIENSAHVEGYIDAREDYEKAVIDFTCMIRKN